jgi:hypothetical protein
MAPEGRWVVDTDPVPPVVGTAAGFFFEFVPSRSTATNAPSATDRITVSASCLTCSASIVQASAERYPSLKVEELYHPEAIAGYSAQLTLTQTGTWRIAPFDVLVEVRSIDAFEPPLVHVRRWSNALDPGCGRADVAALVRRFQDAYNAGDTAGLATVVQETVNFSIAGGAAPVIAVGREAFVAGALARHAADERIVVTRIYVARDTGGTAMEIAATRTATDLPAGGQRLRGKGTMWCTQPQLIHLNLGVG